MRPSVWLLHSENDVTVGAGFESFGFLAQALCLLG
jgi:hypothetical protein